MNPVICIGAALVDDSFHCLNEPLRGTSNPATHFRSAGGVARNVAHHLAQLGNPVELISEFGDDADGHWLRNLCTSAGMGISHSLVAESGTGRFTGIISPSGELYAGASDTHLEITTSFLAKLEGVLKPASAILFDCNLDVTCVVWLLQFCRTNSIPCLVEPVSGLKATNPPSSVGIKTAVSVM